MSSYLTTADRRSEPADRAATSVVDLMTSSGLAWFDMMLKMQRQMQKASLHSLSAYSPSTDIPINGQMPTVIPVGEERLNVGTHTIQGETVRVRRRVVSQPVEQQVTLRDETVVVERRPALGTEPARGVLSETVVEMSDSQQVPTVWKSVHVAEEVVLRKQVTMRTEKIRETVRHDVIDIDHSRASQASTRTNDAVARAASDAFARATSEMVGAVDHEAKAVAASIDKDKDKDKAEAEKKALGLSPIGSPKKA